MNELMHYVPLIHVHSYGRTHGLHWKILPYYKTIIEKIYNRFYPETTEFLPKFLEGDSDLV